MNCDPNALAQAARCFSCLFPTTLESIKTYLLCQWDNASPTPPPVTQDFGIDWTPVNIDLPSEFGLWAFIAPELLNVTDLSINASTQREGYDIEDTTSLVNLSFPNLTSFPDGSYFFLSNNSALVSLSMPALISTPSPSGGGFTIQDHLSLASLSFPSLTGALDIVLIRNNTAILSMSFPVLTHTDGNFTIDGNTAMTTLSLPALVDVNANIIVNSSDALTTISLPSVTHFDGNVEFAVNASLTSINLAACLHTGGSVTLQSNNVLVTISLNAALTVTNGSSWDCSFCALNQTTVDLILHRWNNTAGITGGNINLSGGTNATPSAAGLADKAALIGKGVTVNTN